MFKKDRVYYKGEDYTVRFERVDGCERYFLMFHGQKNSREYEISLEIFKLYYGDFKSPLEKNRDEQRRHIENGDIDGFIISGKLTVTHFEQDSVNKADIDAVLKTCTPTQKRRFELYHYQGYTFREVAEIENCDFKSVKQSVYAVNEKIKKYFL